jgi:homoprotocatechuate degradation regulator HpaR
VEIMLENMRRFDESLPIRLLKAREAVLQYWLPHLRDQGISKEQWRVLRTLAEHGQLTIGDLAEQCFLLRPSVSRMLLGLEAQGLVVREQCTEDSRRGLVSITSKGKQTIVEIAPKLEAYNQYIESKIGSERLSLLSTLLDEVLDALQTTDDEKDPANVPASSDVA